MSNHRIEPNRWQANLRITQNGWGANHRIARKEACEKVKLWAGAGLGRFLGDFGYHLWPFLACGVYAGISDERCFLFPGPWAPTFSAGPI
jgi:hypothetical protein